MNFKQWELSSHLETFHSLNCCTLQACSKTLGLLWFVWCLIQTYKYSKRGTFWSLTCSWNIIYCFECKVARIPSSCWSKLWLEKMYKLSNCWLDTKHLSRFFKIWKNWLYLRFLRGIFISRLLTCSDWIDLYLNAAPGFLLCSENSALWPSVGSLKEVKPCGGTPGGIDVD